MKGHIEPADRTIRRLKFLIIGLEEQADLMQMNAIRMRELMLILPEDQRVMLNYSRELEEAATVTEEWIKKIREVEKTFSGKVLLEAS